MNLPLTRGSFSYRHGFIENSDDVLADLLRLQWDSPDETKVKILGEWKHIPRDQVAFADPGVASYAFSGQKAKHRPMPDVILTLRKRLRELTGVDYNYALVNHYADGSRYIGPHRDSTVGLVKGSSIVGLSFGATRTLVIEPFAQAPNPPPATDKHELEVAHNSMFMFDWDFNQSYKHSIKQTSRSKVDSSRVSVTFRRMEAQTSEEKEETSNCILALHVSPESTAAILFETTDERVLAEFDTKTDIEGYANLWLFCASDIKRGVPLVACDAESLLRALTIGSGRHGIQNQPMPPFQLVQVKDRGAPAKEVAHRIVAAWKDGKFAPAAPKKPSADQYFSPVGQKRKAV